MKNLTMTLALSVGLTAGSLQLFAHHSFAAEYDATKSVRLDGVVTKVEWTNPHAHFYLDVTAERGTPVNWELELGSPNLLQREGWTRNSLRPGDHVAVRGFLSRDGSKLANVRDVRLANGRRVLVGLAARAANAGIAPLQ
jgi:hypothetical protein